MKKSGILIVDDERSVRESLKALLSEKYIVHETRNAREAISTIKKENIDLALLDINLPGMDGLTLLEELKKIDETFNIIMLTGDNSVKTAVSSMRKGAYDYIVKPFDMDELTSLVSKALEESRMRKENTILKGLSDKRRQLVGKSKEIKKVFRIIDDVAQSNSTILIQGETGVGKELIARAIYQKSLRADKFFVAVNCAAIPENLIESELFGHERGSFTGAYDKHIGKFEMANEGTLFLDEIGALPMHTQAKLLRILQERTIERVGGEKVIDIDIRIISATNSDLKKAVENGKFREDLYYRLNVIPIYVPPLRERPEDIEMLARFFLKKLSMISGKKIKGISKDAIDVLRSYSWPGNVRELENLIERIVVLSSGEIIEVKDLPSEISGNKNTSSSSEIEILSLKEATRNFEKDFIENVVKRACGKKLKAAKMMGIHRNTLLQLEKKFK